MRRKGFVLAAALLVILLIAALVAGVFVAATEETQLASTSATREQALVAAESALAYTIESWTQRGSQQIGVGGQQLSTISDGPMPVSLTITRLDSTLYSIVAEARSPSSHTQAIRRVGVIVSVKISADSSILVDPIPDRWWSELL
jgi:Tfp pilus assembly protein PilX